MKTFAIATLFLALVLPASAKDHSADYQVGIFSTTAAVSDGTYSSATCGAYGCTGSAFSAAHNVHMAPRRRICTRLRHRRASRQRW